MVVFDGSVQIDIANRRCGAGGWKIQYGEWCISFIHDKIDDGYIANSICIQNGIYGITLIK